MGRQWPRGPGATRIATGTGVLLQDCCVILASSGFTARSPLLPGRVAGPVRFFYPAPLFLHTILRLPGLSRLAVPAPPSGIIFPVPLPCAGIFARCSLEFGSRFRRCVAHKRLLHVVHLALNFARSDFVSQSFSPCCNGPWMLRSEALLPMWVAI